MTTLSPREEKLRRVFKYMNAGMVFMWRLGLGPFINFWPSVGGRIMVIAHRGRKSGLKRLAPVNYAIIEGEVYCVAGFGAVSDWYRNIIANPNVEVWLPDSWWAGVVEDVPDSAARVSIMRQVMIASGFAARVAGLNPVHMSDEELAAATANYPLLHIRRAEARTGPGGPGDLAWVWPLATMVMFLMLLKKRRRG